MIKTLFIEPESDLRVEKYMPHAVRIGDRVDFDHSGFIWYVADVTWIIDPVKVDKHGAALCELIVRIK